jgi:hypothetical protein
MKKKVIFSILVLLFSLAPVFAVDVTVSLDGTVSSLQQAIDEVRKLKKSDQSIVVEFQTGVYPITEPVVFKPEDSSTEKAPIIYRAGKDQDVVFSGGRQITGWTKNENGVWTTKIPEVAEGNGLSNNFMSTEIGQHVVVNRMNFIITRKKKSIWQLILLRENRNQMHHRAFIATLKDIEPLRSVPKEQLNDVSYAQKIICENPRNLRIIYSVVNKNRQLQRNL